MNLDSGPQYAGDMGSIQQADWIAAFQHVSAVIHQTAQTLGANAEVIWNPGVTSYQNAGNAVVNLYPGDQSVDLIGADVYSDTYNFSLYDFSTGKTDSSFSQWAANPENLIHYYTMPAATQWGTDSSQGHATTLQDLIELAKSTGKPLAIVETGAGNSSNTDHDIQDNPYFVQWLSTTLSAAQANGVKISFVNIWDSNSGGNYQFTSTADGKPEEAVAWEASFGATEPLSATINSMTLAIDTGVSARDFITSDGAVVVSGTMSGVQGSRVIILDGSTLIGVATPSNDGKWSFSTTLTNGTHEIRAMASDPSGNTCNPGSPKEVVVDVSAPVVTIDSKVWGLSTAGKSPITLSGTVEGAYVAEVQVFDGSVSLGFAQVGNSGAWSYQTVLGEGGHALKIIATDIAGNRGGRRPT